MTFFKSFIFQIFLLCILSCKEGEYNNDSVLHTKNNKVENTPNFEDGQSNIGRAIWQKPELVIEKLGDISEKIVADIGAGTGYFSFKLAGKAKKVIAIEIEQKFLNFIDSTKTNLPENLKPKIETRLATPADPKLGVEEVDIILIINTIAYINNLNAYLKSLQKGLKSDGKLMIIDYKMKRLPINAPPKNERIYLDKVEDMLTTAGYEIIQSDDTSLDYQYIIIASKNKI